MDISKIVSEIQIKPTFKKPTHESASLNYQMITILSSDVVAEMENLIEMGVIKRKPVLNFFKKRADQDMKMMSDLYKKKGRTKDLFADYDFTIDYFKKLSKLGNQGNNEELHYIHTALSFIINNAFYVAISIGKTTDIKSIKAVEQLRECTGITNFNEYLFKKKFDDIKKMTNKELEESK